MYFLPLPRKEAFICRSASGLQRDRFIPRARTQRPLRKAIRSKVASNVVEDDINATLWTKKLDRLNDTEKCFLI